jgi:uncharacterized protein YbjQ (UPF0145 family)
VTPLAGGGPARAGLRAPFLASAFALDVEGWQPADPVFGTRVVQIGLGAQMCPLALPRSPRQRMYRTARSGMTASARPVGPSFSELTGYSGTVQAARRQALTEAVAQAAARGAHGVVGMTPTWRALGAGVHQASWQGQAVRHPGSAPLAQPFSSTLGAAALAKLLRSGYAPVAAVIGFSAIHVHSWVTRSYAPGAVRSNYELPTLSDAVSAARHAALRSVREDTDARGAEVVVGLRLGLDLETTGCSVGGEGRLVTASAVGTAAVRFGPPTQSRPRLVIALSDEGSSS